MRSHLGDEVEYLGKDKQGFKYYLSSDYYVYQRYPNKDQWNGWICSFTSWGNALHEILV